MKQKEILENITGTKMPEPTEQEIQKFNIPNSPFWHIQKENYHDLIMGKYKLNKQPFTSAEELHEWINTEQWNIILSMIIIATTDIINNQNKQ